MFIFSYIEKNLKNRITKYKDLQGFIHDGIVKRNLLFCFYFVLGKIDNADESFEGYKLLFPDKTGDLIQQLC